MAIGTLLRSRKKVVKPTAKEQKRITARLQRRYPQMYEPALTKIQRKVYSRAAPAERKELERMTGLRLKRKYRKKTVESQMREAGATLKRSRRGK